MEKNKWDNLRRPLVDIFALVIVCAFMIVIYISLVYDICLPVVMSCIALLIFFICMYFLSRESHWSHPNHSYMRRYIRFDDDVWLVILNNDDGYSFKFHKMHYAMFMVVELLTSHKRKLIDYINIVWFHQSV